MISLLATSKAPSPIKDGTEATFMADVIEASSEVPVIVDFWAPWCGPCKTLTPALEKAVTEAKGKVRLVKVDVDQNQRIAAQMRVQSIPAVFAFVDGQPVDGFMGAQSPAQIKAFVDRLIADVAAATPGSRRRWPRPRRCWPKARSPTRRRPSRRSSPRTRATPAALAGLARAHLALGDVERARDDPRAGAEGQGQRSGDPRRAGAGRARRGERRRRRDRRARARAVERDPGDHQARYDLAHGADRQGRPARARSTRCSSSSAATASGTRARPRRSSSSSSTASARRARRRRRGGGGSAR